LGLFRSIVAAGLIIFLFMALFTYISKPGLGAWITAGYLVSILTIHIRRPDKQFLKINIANHRTVFFFEYILLSIPLLFCQIYFGFIVWVGITLASLLSIPFFHGSFQRKGLNNRLIKAIPNEAFEWKSGVRKYFFFMATVWLIGIFASTYVGSVPVAIVLLGLVMINFYEYGEPLPILMSQELGIKQLLFRKIAVAQTILSFILIPLALAFNFFHPDLWFIPFIEYVLISFILWYAILLKYAFYRPNQQLIAGQVFITIGAMSLFLPFLIPLNWVLTVRFYFKSLANLKSYLDDFN